jgi:hypothetical protein
MMDSVNMCVVYLGAFGCMYDPFDVLTGMRLLKQLYESSYSVRCN